MNSTCKGEKREPLLDFHPQEVSHSAYIIIPIIMMNICDVISEKGPYCGRNSVSLDQLFLHFCNSIFYQNCAGSEKNVFFRCSLATNT